MRNLRSIAGYAAGALALIAAFAHSAHAQSAIAVYNFDSYSPAAEAQYNANGGVPTPITADHAASNSSAKSDALTTNFPSANITLTTGTTTNASGGDASDPNNYAINFQPASGANNGDYIQFSLDATNYQDIALSYVTQRSSSGFASQQVQYFDAASGKFVNFGSPYAPPVQTSGFAAGTVNTVSFSSVAELNNADDLFRIVLTGGTAKSGGGDRFDNIVFLGTQAAPAPAPTPEADTMVSAALGLGLLAGLATRRRRA